MQNKRTDLSERFLEFGANVIKLVISLNKTSIGRHISSQLTRSGTSAGANYEEACGAESRADFAHKMQIVLKELRESSYWLKLINRSNILKSNDKKYQIVLKEAQELTNIIAKSIITAKGEK